MMYAELNPVFQHWYESPSTCAVLWTAKEMNPGFMTVHEWMRNIPQELFTQKKKITTLFSSLCVKIIK